MSPANVANCVASETRFGRKGNVGEAKHFCSAVYLS